MSLLSSWLASSPPDAAVEISPERVSAATMASRGSSLNIQSHATEALPPGAVVAALGAHNIVDAAAVTAAIRTVLGRLEGRVSRVALIIPDVAAKVSLIRFDRIPDRRDDLDQLVRWQVRKSAPFPIEEACVSYMKGASGPDGGGEFVVVQARRDIVEEYERVCAAAGVYAGLVDLATFSALNAVLASPNASPGDWLAVHMRPGYTSIAIVRDEKLIFFRNRPEGEDESLTDLVHQTAMYYQDRLEGQGFARVLLGGSGRTPGAVEDARRGLEERLDTRVEPMGPSDVLTPLMGMLLRTRKEAVGV
ncbi:MAG: type IV pilus biogenesis protein PilM [Longimicrobiales bacterium]